MFYNVEFLIFVVELFDEHLNVQPFLLHLQNNFRSDRVSHIGSATVANNQQVQP